MTSSPLKMYEELSAWWYVLSAPEDYEEEAAFYAEQLAAAGDAPAGSLLEIGSGGGNNASFMKKGYETVTLVDLSPGMLDQSRVLNPECEHVAGDMRTVRLGRLYDRVFVHDAICYMTTEADLSAAIETAFVHCRPGGAALFAPDYLRETFRPSTDWGGEDSPERSMRFLEWVYDPDPTDTTYLVDYAFLLRDADGGTRLEHDRHVEGLFPRERWLAIMTEVGFEPRGVPFAHSEVDHELEVFVCRRPSG